MTRVLVHDFSGHPFQVQLSRELARRGHDVLHVWCSSYVSGRGNLEVTPEDPPTLAIRSIELDQAFAKYSPARRMAQEVRYGRAFSRVAREFGPEVAIESNDPLFAKAWAAGALRRQAVPWIFWLQDLYSVAMANEIQRMLPVVGAAAGRAVVALEGALLREAAHVVAITPDFDERLDAWRVPRERRTVVPNWAPLDELSVVPPSRKWADEQGIAARHIALYSGTLGLKHRPELLVRLADDLAPTDTAVVVVSEGQGADVVAAARAEGRANLYVLPFQPWHDVPRVFAAADVVLTILERDAGVYSAPSKLLTYLCTGKPVVASVPLVNLAARIIQESEAGVVVSPDDEAGFTAAVRRLLADDDLRTTMGRAARAYAEENFDIERIGDRFEAIVERCRVRRASG